MPKQQLQYDELVRITPKALSQFAEMSGWVANGKYRKYSTIYEGKGLPEILVPDISELGDYARVVARLIDSFSSVLNLDTIAVYWSLIDSDRDVIRIRVDGTKYGLLGFVQYCDLVEGCKGLIQASLCSLGKVQLAYSRSDEQAATQKIIDEMLIGHTEIGFSVLTLMSPTLAESASAAANQAEEDGLNVSQARRMSSRLASSLRATRRALREAKAGDDRKLVASYESGLNANLFEALAKIVRDIDNLEVNFAWSSSRPVKRPRPTVRFQSEDKELLQRAAASLREMTSDGSV